jgi:hypothetical protein
MVTRIYLFIHLGNLAVLVYQNANATGVARLVISARTVRHTHTTIGVAKHRKRKIILFRERSILFNIIEADAQNLDVVFFKCANLIAEPATLNGSARGVSLWIKPEYYPTAMQFRERNLPPFVSRERKVGGVFANF